MGAKGTKMGWSWDGDKDKRKCNGELNRQGNMASSSIGEMMGFAIDFSTVFFLKFWHVQLRENPQLERAFGV